MKRVDAYQLLDGTVVIGFDKAQKEAEARYEKALSTLVDRLLREGGGYVDIKAFIELNRRAFENLWVLYDDVVVEGEDEPI